MASCCLAIWRGLNNGAHPAVIVLQEWWGLNEHIQDVARRLAREGYVALAPDLYKGQVATEPDEARKLVMELDMPAAVQEIGSAADFLLAQDYVSGEQVGVMGFCMGGGLVLQSALARSGHGALWRSRSLLRLAAQPRPGCAGSDPDPWPVWG